MRFNCQRRSLLVLGLLIALFSQAAWSDNTGVVSLNIGQSWEDAGRTQTFYLAPEIEKAYVANRHTHVVTNGELFLGIQKPLPEKLQGQIGLAVASTSNATLSGNIWDDADPEFNNYTYRYRVRHNHIALKGQLLADWCYIVMPWVSGSIGLGFNKSEHFTSTPTLYEAVPTPNFANHTTISFTYSIGAGIQYKLTRNWQIGLGYEFSDWGQSRLERAPGQSSGHGLSLKHLYTNGYLINMTYLV